MSPVNENTATHREQSYFTDGRTTILTRPPLHVLLTVTDLTNLIKQLGVILDLKHTHSFYINKSLCKDISDLGLPRVFQSTTHPVGLTICQRIGFL